MTDALALFAPPDAEHAAPELVDLARRVRAAVNTYAHELDRAGARTLLDGARALTYLAERAADRAARLPLAIEEPDDHGPGCDGPYNCTCAPPLTLL